MCSVKQPKPTHQPVSDAPVEGGKSKKGDLAGNPNGDSKTNPRTSALQITVPTTLLRGMAAASPPDRPAMQPEPR